MLHTIKYVHAVIAKISINFRLIWLVTDLVILNKNTSGGASFPGGAPGLQNRGGAYNVPGGFDSHALPPILPAEAVW